MIALVSLRDFVNHVGRIEIERLGHDIGKHRLRAEPPHGARRREEREARHDHFVARPDAQRHQRQQQRVAARGAADGMLRAAILGHRRFELRTRRAMHKRARPRNFGHRGLEFGLHLLVLAD